MQQPNPPHINLIPSDCLMGIFARLSLHDRYTSHIVDVCQHWRTVYQLTSRAVRRLALVGIDLPRPYPLNPVTLPIIPALPNQWLSSFSHIYVRFCHPQAISRICHHLTLYYPNVIDFRLHQPELNIHNNCRSLSRLLSTTWSITLTHLTIDCGGCRTESEESRIYCKPIPSHQPMTESGAAAAAAAAAVEALEDLLVTVSRTCSSRLSHLTLLNNYSIAGECRIGSAYMSILDSRLLFAQLTELHVMDVAAYGRYPLAIRLMGGGDTFISNDDRCWLNNLRKLTLATGGIIHQRFETPIWNGFETVPEFGRPYLCETLRMTFHRILSQLTHLSLYKIRLADCRLLGRIAVTAANDNQQMSMRYLSLAFSDADLVTPLDLIVKELHLELFLQLKHLSIMVLHGLDCCGFRPHALEDRTLRFPSITTLELRNSILLHDYHESRDEEPSESEQMILLRGIAHLFPRLHILSLDNTQIMNHYRRFRTGPNCCSCNREQSSSSGTRRISRQCCARLLRLVLNSVGRQTPATFAELESLQIILEPSHFVYDHPKLPDCLECRLDRREWTEVRRKIII